MNFRQRIHQVLNEGPIGGSEVDPEYIITPSVGLARKRLIAVERPLSELLLQLKYEARGPIRSQSKRIIESI